MSLIEIVRKKRMSEAVAKYLSTLVKDKRIQDKLAKFFVVIFRRLKVDPHVVAYALCLLTRIQYNKTNSLSSQNVKRYFFTAMLLAYNMLTDTPYDLPSWSIIVEESYSVDEIQLMETTYLDIIQWNTHVYNLDVSRMLYTLIGLYNQDIQPSDQVPIPSEIIRTLSLVSDASARHS